jgi:alpha-ketoglutarate-dependent taurine dioxygenase
MNQSAGWNKHTIDLSKVFFQFSNEAKNELTKYISGLSNPEHVDQLAIDPNELPFTKENIEKFRNEVDNGQKFVVLKAIENLDAVGIEKFHWIISKLLGETIVQNEEGRHLIHIYDRDPNRRIKDGARYHQTHESGAIHTDNVNIPENYQYLLVGCVQGAMIGGENIIVSGKSVYDYLQNNAPTELEILKQDFIFEYRGISRELYKAPIITFNNNNGPLFRHLRTYMESAHQRADKPLSQDQIRSLDALDATLSMSEFQLLYKLCPGEILVANDSQILHDRRSFVDDKNAIVFDDYKKNKSNQLIKRTLLRTWVRKV